MPTTCCGRRAQGPEASTNSPDPPPRIGGQPPCAACARFHTTTFDIKYYTYSIIQLRGRRQKQGGLGTTQCQTRHGRWPFAVVLISRGASTHTLSRQKCIHISLPTYLQGPRPHRSTFLLSCLFSGFHDFDLVVLIAPSGVACFCVLPSHKGGVAADEGCGTRKCSRVQVHSSFFWAPGREAPFPPPYLLPLFSLSSTQAGMRLAFGDGAV